MLDHANASIARNDFHEALDYIGKARQLDPENEDIGALEEQVRGACDGASPNQAEPLWTLRWFVSTLEAYSPKPWSSPQGGYEEALHL